MCLTFDFFNFVINCALFRLVLASLYCGTVLVRLALLVILLCLGSAMLKVVCDACRRRSMTPILHALLVGAVLVWRNGVGSVYLGPPKSMLVM